MTSALNAITVKMPEAMRITGMSRQKLMEAIHSTNGPRLRAKMNGSHYLFYYEDLLAFVDSLPDA